MRGQVGQIGRAHPHLVPHAALVDSGLDAVVGDIAEEVDDGGLVVVVVVALRLQLGQHAHAVLVGPVGQQHGMVAVRPDRVVVAVDDQAAVDAGHLLEARVRVVPVAAALHDLEAVGEALARGDAGKADAGHAVHLERQDDAVPVDRGRLAQPVGDANGHRIALAPAQRRPRQHAVDRVGDGRLASEVDHRLLDDQVELGARQHRRAAAARAPRAVRLLGPACAGHAGQCTEHAPRHQSLHETPARQMGRQGQGGRGNGWHGGDPCFLSLSIVVYRVASIRTRQ